MLSGTDLVMPESLWVNRLREFEPFNISIDTQGNTLFEQNKATDTQRKLPIIEAINQ
jgi:L(+)-tartrate dehydratase beta subunit